MKKILISGSIVLLASSTILFLAGCASTHIKKLSGPEFEKQAQKCAQVGSFAWTTYVGTSYQRAYLESGHPALIGKGLKTTVYWTPLSELPTNLAAKLKAGTPPWTNWFDQPKSYPKAQANPEGK